jgi:hypothetical protein
MENIKTWSERAEEQGICTSEARDEEIKELRAKLAAREADILDLSAQFRTKLDSLQAKLADLDGQPALTVRLTSFPESNGKRNWNALLVRVDEWDGLVGNCGGISLARGELWNRVAWEAECAKFLIGERETEPFILDYGDDISAPEEWSGEVHSTRLNWRKAASKLSASNENNSPQR